MALEQLVFHVVMLRKMNLLYNMLMIAVLFESVLDLRLNLNETTFVYDHII